LSKEQERIFEDFLTKLFNKSIEGLNEVLNELSRFRRYSWYHSNFYQLHHLKSHITSIQEQYDLTIQNITRDIKKQKEYAKEILSKNLESTINKEEYLNELINQIDYLVDKISNQFLLITIFSAISLYYSIDTIIALFTGTGVLGIAPLRMGFVINNTASEIMFRDKLEEIDEKLTFIINNTRIIKNQRLDNLNLYFNIFRKKLSH
jgi:hypothetical protein